MPKRFLSVSMAAAIMAGCGAAHHNTDMPALYPVEGLSAEQIMQSAHDAAGGESWRRPKSLSMMGYGVFYKGGEAVKHETHNMWRVYDAGKTDAHRVDGKVRLESLLGGQRIIDLSYDGEITYTAAGPQAPSEADKQWSSSFGFGVVRHALDDGYAVARQPDDLTDGRPSFIIKVTDPMGGTTQFGIAQDDYAILKVGFNTPRGWHERIYSNFYSNPGVAWVQPGRVRLYYNGVKTNEVIWTSFSINEDLPDCLFVLPEAQDCRPSY